MYRNFIRPILFKFNPELAHQIVFSLLKLLDYIPLGRKVVRLFYKRSHPSLAREVFGIKFPNPVGLAGGLDKNGEFYNELSDFGFGFVEIGSLTARPQPGNPKPRLFRVVQDKAIINRMGINNKGVTNAIDNINRKAPEVIIAGNIAPNSSSQGEQVAEDYKSAFSLIYDSVDMIVINISCPNVEGLTSLQDVSSLSDIMDNLLDMRTGFDRYKPVLLKLSPDLSHPQIDDLIEYSLRSGIDGIVAGNTTRKRDGLTISENEIEKIGKGGMSGAPVFSRNLEMVRYIHDRSAGKLPVIGVGGIMSPEQARMMLDAGASLIEIYTGFIYEGPEIVEKILKGLDN
jgi:dihydroorotate dehydrogenase